MSAEPSNGYSQPGIPKFDGDYDHWRMVMENFLRSKEYWGVVETGFMVPENEEGLSDTEKKALEELKLKDLKAKNYLFSSIDKSILKTITKKETAKQLWDAMKVKCHGNARVQRAQLNRLRRSFEVLAMKNGESITDYFGRVMMIATDMRNYGEDMPDVKIVEKILRTLTEKWNYIVCSIEESKDIDQLSVDALQSSLLVHEQKFRKDVEGEDEQAFKVSYDGGRGGRGRGVARGRGRGRGRHVFSRSTIECFKCHKLGHFQYECPGWKSEANCAVEDEELLLMAYVGVNESKADAWFLDSGCSNHMSGHRILFYELDEGFKTSVKLGNNSRMDVTGRGNVKLFYNGMRHIITGVYYVPELKSNLLSLGQFQEKGLAIVMQGGVCKIYHPDKGVIIATNMSANRMFVVLSESQGQYSSSSVNNNCLIASGDCATQLWHRRYGHLNYKTLKELESKKMVRGLLKITGTENVCTDCLVGKQHRDPIPKRSSWRAGQILDLVHADICGPINPMSISNKRYTLCFIDDYSRKSWIYFLVEKSEAFSHF